MSKFKKIAPATYLIPQEGGMRVPGLVIATEELLADVEEDQSLEQLRNVAHLQGIVGHSIAMPDMHWGYGFPIGGVAAMDAETGVISPGGVGYDINCGVRLAIIPIPYKEISEKKRSDLLKVLYRLIPSGVGHGSKGQGIISDKEYRRLLERGARWSIEQGYGFEADLDHIESNGVIDGADFDAVSSHAKVRGRNQLGTVGSGNHFVEIGEVKNIFREDVASAWGVVEGFTYALIHSGSRGFGHQVCQDTLNEFMEAGFAQGLPDRQLVAAPIQSEWGRRYFGAMAAAANFAFNNRQQLLHHVRVGFHEVLGIDRHDVRLIYDVCHNIAKFETYEVNGKPTRLCVHRKGATRAFKVGAPELAPLFRKTGQPVLVPGDMGRASYLMVGLGNKLTWCSACHGAGRARSRVKSMALWKGRDPVEHMRAQGVKVMANSYRTIAEEMPDAYKDVDKVVGAVQEARLAAKVAILRPSLVIKG